MTWYAAHVVHVIRYERGPQRRFPAWENVLLLRALSEELAFAKAEELGRAAADEVVGPTFYRGRAARWEFAGVRKIVECCLMGKMPGDTDEVTYNELEFRSLTDAKKFARGQAVAVRHDDRLRVLNETQRTAEPKPKRKRA